MGFLSFAGRRAVHTAVTLALLLVFMFVLFRLIPGDPTTLLLGTGELTLEAQQRLRTQWGLDQSMFEQLIAYCRNLLSGELGLSFYYRRPVTEVIAPMLVNTLILMVPVLVLAIGLGIAIGTWLGWRRGERVEELGAVLVLIPRALPVFWTGIVFLSLFAYKLQWFPIGGIRETFFYPETWYQHLPYYDVLRHLVLPVATGVLASMADPLMIMRTSLIEVRDEEFMVLARARGLTTRSLQRLARRIGVPAGAHLQRHHGRLRLRRPGSARGRLHVAGHGAPDGQQRHAARLSGGAGRLLPDGGRGRSCSTSSSICSTAGSIRESAMTDASASLARTSTFDVRVRAPARRVAQISRHRLRDVVGHVRHDRACDHRRGRCAESLDRALRSDRQPFQRRRPAQAPRAAVGDALARHHLLRPRRALADDRRDADRAGRRYHLRVFHRHHRHQYRASGRLLRRARRRRADAHHRTGLRHPVHSVRGCPGGAARAVAVEHDPHHLAADVAHDGARDPLPGAVAARARLRQGGEDRRAPRTFASSTCTSFPTCCP